jgi:hypothetical protein
MFAWMVGKEAVEGDYPIRRTDLQTENAMGFLVVRKLQADAGTQGGKSDKDQGVWW